MPIEKQDGTKYVEVHHIKNLSEEYDEEGTLDKKGYSRPGFFGSINHYDANGKK